jgi:4-amino-4-deoxy-L-arabinose transferase-like glycosyltransferase
MPTKTESPNQPPVSWERVLLAIILVAGFWLRFQNIGAIEFNIDQVYPVWQALNTLDTGELPLTGQGTSVLFSNPTLTGYFFVPLMLLSREPIMAFLLTITLNSFAIWLAYRGLRWLIGTRPALLAAAFFAASPWLIEDSRRTWVQSLLPFFVCLIFWALVPVLTRQTRHPARRTLIALIGLALFANTYLLSYALAAPVGLLMLMFWPRIPKQTLVTGSLVFLAFLGLYGIGLHNEWDDTQRDIDEFFEGESRLSSEALEHAVRQVTGDDYAAARGLNAPADDAQLRADLSYNLHLFWSVILLAGVIQALYLVIRWRRSTPHRRETALILLVWFFLPVLMMTYVSRDVHPFYLILSVPAGHGLLAWVLAPLLKDLRTGTIVSVVVVFTAGLFSINTIRFAQESAAHPAEHAPYTLPLAEVMQLGNAVQTVHEGETIHSPIDPWTTMIIAGEITPIVRSDTLDRAIILNDEQGLFVLYHAPQQPITSPPGGIPAGKPVNFSDGSGFSLWTVDKNIEPANPASIPSDIGWRFMGWELEGQLAPGETAQLITFWQIEQLFPDRVGWVFTPFAHIFDGNGQLIVNDAFGEVISPDHWQVGSLMVYKMNLPVPPDSSGPYAVQIGLFDRVRLINGIFNYPGETEQVYTANLMIIPGEE